MNTLEVQDFNFKLSQVKKSIAEAEIGKGLVNIQMIKLWWNVKFI